MLYKSIISCRVCGNRNLKSVINLGNSALSGVFPSLGEKIEEGPLELVKCVSNEGDSNCGLLQLAHNYDMAKLYGDNYGYRSGLNMSMVNHLKEIAEEIKKIVTLKKGDLVIDIGSNDATLLKAYNNKKLTLLGIDPTAKKFKDFYPDYIKFAPEFFSSSVVSKQTAKKAKVITTIAMFYDLPNPLNFVKNIKESLADDGIWVSEQSYMPDMLDNVSYDTICHEHLEYYSLKQVKWMLDKVGMKLLRVSKNDTNGASFRFIASKKEASYKEDALTVNKFLNEEKKRGIDNLKTYKDFEKKVFEHKNALLNLVNKLRKNHKTIAGYGASTKGNVILQFCKFSTKGIYHIAEVNEYKFGKYTPGTYIPIIPEHQSKAMKPDYYLVLPWHFKEGILKREKEYLKNGGHLIFPLPKLLVL